MSDFFIGEKTVERERVMFGEKFVSVILKISKPARSSGYMVSKVDYFAIRERFQRKEVKRRSESKKPVLESPSLIELAENFAKATSSWAQSGFPVANRKEYDRRSSICDKCDFWEPDSRLGAGKCTYPGCGCTKFKRWLQTESCPAGKW